jgi:hypothetical protein
MDLTNYAKYGISLCTSQNEGVDYYMVSLTYGKKWTVQMPVEHSEQKVMCAKIKEDNTYCYNRRSGTLTDYCSFMPSWEAQHRYSAALVQMYGRFLQEIAKYPEYAKIHKKYTYIFATNSCDAITKHLEYFPTAKCASCSKETCNKCDQNKKNITRIKKGLKKLMPNRIQKTQ